MNNIDQMHFGVNGCVNETGTSAVTGKFFACQILTDAVFATFTDGSATGDAITGITIPAGVTLYGDITAVTLTSGAVRLYKK